MNCTAEEPLMILPSDLIGSVEAAGILGITRPSLTRRVKAGTLTPLARLTEGKRPIFVFDRSAIQAEATK